VYKLQEKNLAKLFRDAMTLSDDDYSRMVNYKHASMQPYGAPVGDFPMVVHNII
jgi:DNA ligase-4